MAYSTYTHALPHEHDYDARFAFALELVGSLLPLQLQRPQPFRPYCAVHVFGGASPAPIVAWSNTSWGFAPSISEDFSVASSQPELHYPSPFPVTFELAASLVSRCVGYFSTYSASSLLGGPATSEPVFRDEGGRTALLASAGANSGAVVCQIDSAICLALPSLLRVLRCLACSGVNRLPAETAVDVVVRTIAGRYERSSIEARAQSHFICKAVLCILVIKFVVFNV